MGWLKKDAESIVLKTSAVSPPSAAGAAVIADPEAERTLSKPKARTEVYSVRVRNGFKKEIVRLQAELQLDRQELGWQGKKVTEGEIMDLLLGSFKAGRERGASMSRAAPLSEDVWEGLEAIANTFGTTPSLIIEYLVAQKASELKLFPRK